MSVETIRNDSLVDGISYEDYLSQWEEYLEKNEPQKLSGEEKNRYEFRKLNKHRSNRINKTYKVSEELKSLLAEIKSEQTWMVLTENWCGDSAQTLPYIAKIAEQSDKIDLKILYRDENPDIMDQYLTNGKTRSIPKLIAFDEYDNELFQWGPRPTEAQKFVKDELAKGREKQDVYQELHLWYGRDRGKAIEEEFKNLLFNKS